MFILQTFAASVASIFILFVLAKLMGNRQISQLSIFDYINGITIGSIVAEMATMLDGDFIRPLIATIIYSSITILFAVVTDRSIKIRRIITGKPLILLNRGMLYSENFKIAKIDVGEFLTLCRNGGYFNIDEIEIAVLETNGKLSILPKSESRTLTPADINIYPPPSAAQTSLVINGSILYDNLKSIGKNDRWLIKKLNEQNVTDVKLVFYAGYAGADNVSVYLKANQSATRDMFE